MRGEWDVSIRRACGVFEMDTSTYHYKSRRPGQAALEQRVREICQTRVRYGYRRIHVLLRREGWCHGQNKTRRVYRELGLQLRNAEAPGQGEAAERSPAGDAIERDLGDGLRSRSARHRSEAACADGRRYVLALLAGLGAAVHIPRRRRCRRARKGRLAIWVADDDPGRSRH
jgi:hypothetical protein